MFVPFVQKITLALIIDFAAVVYQKSIESMGHSHDSVKNIKIAFFLNAGFTILEIAGGLWTNSVAILADAIHDMGDSISLGLAWFLQHYSEKGSDNKYTYGYRRYSLLGALIIGLLLIGGSLFVLSEAIPRLMSPEESNAPGMIVFALVGIAVNGAAVLRLRGDQTMNTQMIAWHLLEDVLGWVAVFVAGVILLFVDLPIIDPILAVLFTLYVLYNVVRNLRKTLTLFLQGAPENIDVSKLEQRFQEIEGVKSSHHTHLWSLDGEHHVLTTHLVVDETISREEVIKIKLACKQLLLNEEVEHLTIEIEYNNEACLLAV